MDDEDQDLSAEQVRDNIARLHTEMELGAGRLARVEQLMRQVMALLDVPDVAA